MRPSICNESFEIPLGFVNPSVHRNVEPEKRLKMFVSCRDFGFKCASPWNLLSQGPEQSSERKSRTAWSWICLAFLNGFIE